MAYTTHNFQSGDKLYAAQLNEMDAQIAKNEEDAAALSKNVSQLSQENATVNALLDVQTIAIPPNLNATKYQSGTKNGVSYTVNTDNSISLSGTSTADTWPIPDVPSRAAAGFWLEAGTYTMSTTSKKNVAAIYLCTYEDASAVTTYTSHWPSWDTGCVTFTTSKRLFVVAAPTFYSGAVLDGFMLRAKIEEGTVATEYVSPWLSGNDGALTSVRLDKIEARIGVGDVPDYYMTGDYLENKAARINELGENADDVCAFITDQHWSLNAGKSPALLQYLAEKCRIPRIFCGGDVENDGINQNYIRMMDKAYSGKMHYVQGNHDWWYPTTGKELAYWYDSGKPEQIGNTERHYYYVDNPQQKIRYIVLSSQNVGVSVSDPWAWGYEAEQITWLTTTALNVEAGWTIIVFTHLIYHVNTEGGFTLDTHAQAVTNALDEYSGNGEIAAIFCGHTHKDGVEHTAGGIPVIITTCDKNKSGGETGVVANQWANRASGTINEQAFDVVTLDKTNKTITLVRIGYPADNWVDGTSSGTVQERVVTY